MKKLILILLLSFSLSSVASPHKGFWHFVYKHKIRLITLTVSVISVIAISRGHLSFLFESKEVTYKFGLQTKLKTCIASLNTK